MDPSPLLHSQAPMPPAKIVQRPYGKFKHFFSDGSCIAAPVRCQSHLRRARAASLLRTVRARQRSEARDLFPVGALAQG